MGFVIPILAVIKKKELTVPRFIGEYEAKLDAKGRVLLPSGLKRQIPNEAQDTLVINRGLDKCLALFTRASWERELVKLDQLSNFNPQHRKLKRLFQNGATILTIDKAGRILIPKRLQLYANIKSELVFSSFDNKIELWDKKEFDRQQEISPEDLSDLADEVMGAINQHE